MIRPEEVKKKERKKESKIRISNENKYGRRGVRKDRNEDKMEQVKIPAENPWDFETLRNTDGPWGIKVRVKGQGS